jgi:hypothetical protein
VENGKRPRVGDQTDVQRMNRAGYAGLTWMEQHMMMSPMPGRLPVCRTKARNSISHVVAMLTGTEPDCRPKNKTTHIGSPDHSSIGIPIQNHPETKEVISILMVSLFQ